MENLILIKEKITIICFVIFLILMSLIFLESLYIVRVIWYDSDSTYIRDINSKNIPIQNSIKPKPIEIPARVGFWQKLIRFLPLQRISFGVYN